MLYYIYARLVFFVFSAKDIPLLDGNDFNMKQSNSTESLQFSLEAIKSATQNFSIANKLGEGGFGAVYRVRHPYSNETF